MALDFGLIKDTGLLEKLFRRKKQPTPVDILTGYAHWAKSYPAYAHNPLMEMEEEAMLSLLPADLSEQVCLDLACGSGRYLLHMQADRTDRAVGVDYSAEMLAEARRASALLVRSPFLALPFAGETFDVITCGLAVGHEKNLRQTLAEAARVLRTGGLIVYSDFHPFATLAGWQRSFTTANGDTFRLEHYLHLYQDHQQACQAAGLTITHILEPIAGEHAPLGFQQFPVVLVIQAVKANIGPIKL